MHDVPCLQLCDGMMAYLAWWGVECRYHLFGSGVSVNPLAVRANNNLAVLLGRGGYPEVVQLPLLHCQMRAC